MTTTERIIQLSTQEGFVEAYFDILKTTDCTNTDAYEKLETEFESYFDRRRYSSYNSFRNVRDRKNK